MQSSHNTFILGQQLKLALRGNPVDIVYAEAFPIALNLGYRCLELDVFYRAHERAGGKLLVLTLTLSLTPTLTLTLALTLSLSLALT